MGIRGSEEEQSSYVGPARSATGRIHATTPDLVLVYETPDDAVAARFSLMLNRFGAVRTRTLKAFPEGAYRQIVASLK
jgi:uncharacterized protein with GYD domain